MKCRSYRRVSWIAALLVCLVVVGPARSEGTAQKTYPKAFEFTYEDVNPKSPTRGQKISLKDMYEPEGLVLNFLASWCPPCWQEVPSFVELDKKVSTPVVFIAADEASGVRDLMVRLEKTEISQPVLLVPRAEIAMLEQHYNHQMLPSTYMIDPTGGIRQVFEGMISENTLVRAMKVHFPDNGSEAIPTKQRSSQGAVSY